MKNIFLNLFAISIIFTSWAYADTQCECKDLGGKSGIRLLVKADASTIQGRVFNEKMSSLSNRVDCESAKMTLVELSVCPSVRDPFWEIYTVGVGTSCEAATNNATEKCKANGFSGFAGSSCIENDCDITCADPRVEGICIK
jgi:hypothetical protein